jgi:hypothetical protein
MSVLIDPYTRGEVGELHEVVDGRLVPISAEEANKRLLSSIHGPSQIFPLVRDSADYDSAVEDIFPLSHEEAGNIQRKEMEAKLEKIGVKSIGIGDPLPRCAYQEWTKYDIQWRGDEWRWDRAFAVSNPVNCNSTSDCPITVTETKTVTWSADFSFEGLFEFVNMKIGGAYFQARSTSVGYTMSVPRGRTAQIRFIPMMQHVNGWVSRTVRFSDCRTEVRYNHQWNPIYFPCHGHDGSAYGLYQLQYLR